VYRAVGEVVAGCIAVKERVQYIEGSRLLGPWGVEKRSGGYPGEVDRRKISDRKCPMDMPCVRFKRIVLERHRSVS
jgi:hypothetical protein